MGILTDKVGEGLTALSIRFKKGLGDFIIFAASKGIEAFMNIMAASAAKSLKPIIDSLESQTTIPPELKAILDEIRTPTGEFAAALATRAGNAAVGSSLSKFIDYLTRPITLGLSYAKEYVLMDIDNAIALYQRHEMDLPELLATAHKHGLSDEFVRRLIKLKELRFPSDLVFALYHRDNARWGPLIDDLRQIGIDEDRIKALAELSWVVPGKGDVVNFAVREVYSPEIVEKFGQYQDYPSEAEADAEAAGIKPADFRKYWAAHWDLPGVAQGFDMYHRGLIDLSTLKLLLRARDVMPFWRDKLVATAWDLPNRIELRMMARYGLIDKPKLMEILGKTGVDPQYREIIADMNLAVGLITDLRSRYANGYITPDQISAELQAAGLSADIQTRLYQYIVKVEKPARTAAEKDLTKAEIIKGVKLGVITWEEGIEQLVAMGYDEEEAMYILAINLEVAAGSPHNVGDFKRLTELHRAASGLPTERKPEEIAASEKAVAAKFPIKAKLSEEEAKTRVDTARRKRRRGELTRDQEVTELLAIGLDISLATAYAENDDLRLQKGVSD